MFGRKTFGKRQPGTFGKRVAIGNSDTSVQQAPTPGNAPSLHTTDQPGVATGDASGISDPGNSRERQYPPVIIRRSTMQGDDVGARVSALIDFVNFTQGRLQYARNELSPRALQVYHADYYEAQVLNGGHAQFLHNSMIGGVFMHVYADVMKCLDSMELRENRVIFEKFARWFTNNRQRLERRFRYEELTEQDKNFLRQLDDTFLALPHYHIRQHAGRWMEHWPELMVVNDDAWEETIKRHYPYGEIQQWRAEARAIDKHQGWFTNPLMVAANILAGNTGNILLEIRGGEFLENGGMRWTVSTTGGLYYLDDVDEEFALRELIPGERPEVTQELASLFGSMDEKDRRRFTELLGEYTPNRVGNVLARKSKEFVAFLIERVRPLDPAAHYTLLLKQFRGWDELHLLWLTPADENEARRQIAETFKRGSRDFSWKLVAIKGDELVPFEVFLCSQGMVALPHGVPASKLGDGTGVTAKVTNEDVRFYRERIRKAIPTFEEPVLFQ